MLRLCPIYPSPTNIVLHAMVDVNLLYPVRAISVLNLLLVLTYRPLQVQSIELLHDRQRER